MKPLGSLHFINLKYYNIDVINNKEHLSTRISIVCIVYLVDFVLLSEGIKLSIDEIKEGDNLQGGDLHTDLIELDHLTEHDGH